MDEELRQFLAQIATRQDARIEALEGKLAAMETRLDAKIEKAETALLTAFHSKLEGGDGKGKP